MGQPRGNPTNLDAELARALKIANDAGDLARIDRVVEEIRARRRAAATNVIAIDPKKRGAR